LADERTASSVDKKIGARVRVRRVEIGVSQQRLAELIGVTFQQVQKYENGTNRIAAGRLLDIAYVLETPITTFFEGLRPRGAKTSAAQGDDINAALAVPGAHDLLRSYASMKPKMRRRMLDLAAVLSDED
jgi:transcriptional regulator with XRE-family HTH domain